MLSEQSDYREVPMEETLKVLEEKRKSVCKKIGEIGDFRRGTVSVNYRKCGKKNCICTKPGHPGHGPQYLWNTTIKGKSYAKNLKLGSEMKKYMEEIANYRTFLQCCSDLVELNEKLCDLRPIPEIEGKDEQDELKKKLEQFFKKRFKKRSTVL
jgi:hypothetical protein